MSNAHLSAVSNRSRKIQVLNEIVRVLRDHLEQREVKIDGLVTNVLCCKERIKNLEGKLNEEEKSVQSHKEVFEMPYYCLNNDRKLSDSHFFKSSYGKHYNAESNHHKMLTEERRNECERLVPRCFRGKRFLSTFC